MKRRLSLSYQQHFTGFIMGVAPVVAAAGIIVNHLTFLDDSILVLVVEHGASATNSYKLRLHAEQKRLFRQAA